MTSQRSSRKTSYSPFSFFAFELRQNWPVFVTNLIVFLIFDVAVLAMVLTNRHGGVSRLQPEQVLVIARNMRVAQVVVSGFCAVFSGFGAMSYLNSRVGVQFYHSIPVWRGVLYLNEYVVRAICFLVPKTLGTALSCLVSGAITGFWEPSVAAAYFSGCGVAVLYFFLFLSIIFFAASFTGTAFARIVVAGLIVFLPAALVMCVYAVLSMETVYASYDGLADLAIRLLSPVRAVMIADGSDVFSPSKTLVLSALFAGLFFLAGGILYGNRKSESSGTPVLSAAAGTLIKYSCMFCAATLGGLIFQLFFDTAVSFCVGAVTAALFCMMLMNMILTKTSRRMFAGLAGLGIFCALYIAFFVLFGLDVVGLDRHVPSPDSLSAVTVSTQTAEKIRITEQEDIRALCAAVQEYLDSEGNTQEADAYPAGTETTVIFDADGEEWGVEDWLTRDLFSDYPFMQWISVTFTPRVGLTETKTLRADRTALAGILNATADSREFADSYFRLSEKPLYSAEIRGVVSPSEQLSASSASDMLTAMRAEYDGASWFQRVSLRRLLVTESRKGIPYWESSFPIYGETQEEWQTYLSQIDKILTANRASGELHVWQNPDEIRAICENAVLMVDNCTSAYTRLEDEYTLAVVFRTAEPEQEGEYILGAFLAGCVPDFVREKN